MNSFDLGTIAAAGGGVIIDARRHNAFDVGTIVGKSTSIVIVKHAKKYNAFDCKSIAEKNPARVVFDFTDG